MRKIVTIGEKHVIARDEGLTAACDYRAEAQQRLLAAEGGPGPAAEANAAPACQLAEGRGLAAVAGDPATSAVPSAGALAAALCGGVLAEAVLSPGCNQ